MSNAKHDDGGTAFPTEPKNLGYEGSDGTGAAPGMSLWDHYFGLAMQSLLERGFMGDSTDGEPCHYAEENKTSKQQDARGTGLPCLARDAANVADAMIAEKRKREARQ